MSKKITVFDLFLLISSTLFALFIAEMIFRFYLFGWNSFSIEKVNSVHGIGVSGFVQTSSYSEVVYELKPHLNSYFKLAVFKTNSQGLRDKEYSIVKPKNTFRVAVLGDSYTMPAGVNIENAYHSLLEEKLNSNKTEISYEFINFGVGGYNLRQYLGVLKYKALKYEPQMIIIGFCPENDEHMAKEKFFLGHYKPLDRNYPFFNSFMMQSIILKIKGFLKKLEKNEKIKFLQLQKKKEVYMRKIFSQIAAVANEKNIPVIVVYLAHRKKALSQLTRVKNAATESIPYFLDLSHRFNEIDDNDKDYWIYPIDAHPNNKAHNIFADEIYKFLKSHSLI